MFITSRNFSQLRELISLPTGQRNNPEVILVPCRKHPETIRRESKRCCVACGQRARLHLIHRKTGKVLGQEDEAAPSLGQREEPEPPGDERVMERAVQHVTMIACRPLAKGH